MNKNLAKWLGLLSAIIGALMIIGSLIAWNTVSSQLKEEQITVPSDASCEQGKLVNGPVSAYCQAEIIKEHSLKSGDGLTYAQLGDKIKEATAAKDQAAVDKYTKARTTAMNGSFLRASLFTSVLAYGVSLLALGTGVGLAALGAALMSLANALGLRKHDDVVVTKPVATTTTTTGATATH